MTQKIERIRELTTQLNAYRNEYYNLGEPSVSDAVYDRLFDELAKLENETEVFMANSPTRTVGYPAVSDLEKVRHEIPLLSLDKTKSVEELLEFCKGRRMNLSNKLDGLTTEIIYEDGKLVRLSTRGDGDIGEDVTHNARAISGIPQSIPYKERLVVVGESLIRNSDFERLKKVLLDSSGKPYKNSRNLAAGSIRLHDSSVCAQRCLHFIPFGINEGLDDAADIPDSKQSKLVKLTEFGFDKVRTVQFETIDAAAMENYLEVLKQNAADADLPIDGQVLSFDEIAYSKTCGRTGHHFKDGIAFKYEDDLFETVLREVQWTPTRTGEISAVAIFDAVEIDGCEVQRATLHNVSFIENLELMIGDRILVSKRNQIIPHVEANLTMGHYDEQMMIPKTCPCCGKPTRIGITKLSAGNGEVREIKTLYCDNPDCDTQRLRQFVHFVSKKAMDIEGLSQATLEKFISCGWLDTFMDIYTLDAHKDEITAMEGFGEKSWQRLWNAIQTSRNTTFEKYLISMDIPMIGSNASKALSRQFGGNPDAFLDAVDNGFDFTVLPDFGTVLNDNIHDWFEVEENRALWKELQKFMNMKEEMIMENKNSTFAGTTIVVTGKVEPYSRNEINAKIESLGAKAGSSVSKNTNYLVCGENAGSKLAKAKELGVTILTPAEFFAMIGE